MEAKGNEPVRGSTNDVATVAGAGPDTLSPMDGATRTKALLHAYEESIRLSCRLAVTIVYLDFLAQIAGKPYVVHDWLIGLILSPFGGAIYEFLTGRITAWVKSKKPEPVPAVPPAT